jgi:hypothetical protein
LVRHGWRLPHELIWCEICTGWLYLDSKVITPPLILPLLAAASESVFATPSMATNRHKARRPVVMRK